MKKFWILNILLISVQVWAAAQFNQLGSNSRGGTRLSGQQQGRRGMDQSENNEEKEQGSQTPFIPREVKNWRLVDDYSLSDTITVDTLSTGFQIYNPIYQRSIANVYTGNLGAPAQSVIIEDMSVGQNFIFAKNLRYWFTEPEEWKYYNTKTPYTNLYFQHSGPKRRSEEHLGILFTQNINKDLNVGFNYKLISSIGKYMAQQVENRFFRLFSSYSGKKYSIHGSFVYGKTDQLRNGGIVDDDNILHPEKYNYKKAEDLQVFFLDASERIDNYKFFINQKLNIGEITVPVNDSVKTKTPLATLSHTFEWDRYRRTYNIDELSEETDTIEFYSQKLIDKTQTKDTTYLTTLRNTIQLKFNEEANPFLHFGMRVYLMHEIEKMRWPDKSDSKLDSNNVETYIYHQQQEQRSATAIGGQLFKNRGDNFFYDGGLKIWFQGHKAGDSEITGGFNSQFRIRKDTAGLFARGGIYLTSPDFYTEQYYSNQFTWNKRFDPTKTVKIRGGINIPTRKLSLTGEAHLINDYIYWNQEALPEQTGEFLQLIEVKLKKHFKLWNLHSRNEIIYQITSNDAVIPVPNLAVFSSNYYQNTLFQVLFCQIGFDVRYHSEYYAPDFIPSTGQFFIQRKRKVGNYPVIDPFVNFHLKRANIFVKYYHANKGYPDNNYFHTIGYPINPRGIRFGISWNFYD
jgi:hypothetical protein